ncbi:MAG: hypothetical protein ACOY33_12040 [Pseudomonadota bacterium]
MRQWAIACGALVLLTGCATKVAPQIVTGYKPPQDIEAYCAEKGAGEKPEWVAKCTNEVSFRVRSTAFCEACAGRGGSMNTCLRTAASLREAAIKATPEGKQPPIPLTCDKLNVTCTGYPDSATERSMKASRESRAKVDMTSWPGAWCPLKKR